MRLVLGMVCVMREAQVSTELHTRGRLTVRVPMCVVRRHVWGVRELTGAGAQLLRSAGSSCGDPTVAVIHPIQDPLGRADRGAVDIVSTDRGRGKRQEPRVVVRLADGALACNILISTIDLCITIVTPHSQLTHSRQMD